MNKFQDTEIHYTLMYINLLITRAYGEVFSTILPIHMSGLYYMGVSTIVCMEILMKRREKSMAVTY